MSTLKVDSIQDTSGNDQYTVNASWSYDQVTPAINKSRNISSITDVATANYTANLSITMPDAYYTTGGGWPTVPNTGADRTLQAHDRTTTSCGFYAVAANAGYDSKTCGLITG